MNTLNNHQTGGCTEGHITRQQRRQPAKATPVRAKPSALIAGLMAGFMADADLDLLFLMQGQSSEYVKAAFSEDDYAF